MKLFEDIETIEDIVDQPKGTIFYLHSFMGNFQMKKSLRNYYHEYNFFAINLPGHGNSKVKSINETRIPYCINLVKSYIEKHSLHNLIMIGHSLGGGIIASLNKIIPERISLNIFEAPANGAMLDNINVIKRLVPNNIEDTKFIINNLYYDPIKTFGSRLDSIIKYEYEKSKKFNIFKSNFEVEIVQQNTKIFDEGFKSIKIPSLVIIGEKDGILPKQLMINNFQKINNFNLELETILNASHAIYNEQKQTFLGLLDDFLKKNYAKK